MKLLRFEEFNEVWTTKKMSMQMLKIKFFGKKALMPVKTNLIYCTSWRQYSEPELMLPIFQHFICFVLNLFIHWESQIFPRWLADPSAQRALLARKRRWQLTGWADKKQAMLPQIPRKEAKRTCQTSNQNSHNRFLEMVGQILSSFCKAAGLVRPHVHNSNSS